MKLVVVRKVWTENASGQESLTVDIISRNCSIFFLIFNIGLQKILGSDPSHLERNFRTSPLEETKT